MDDPSQPSHHISETLRHRNKILPVLLLLPHPILRPPPSSLPSLPHYAFHPAWCASQAVIGPKAAKGGSDAGEPKRGVLELGNVKALERDPKGSGGDRLDADFWAGKGGGGGGGGDAGGEVRVGEPGRG